jgi:hypothetical protein
MCPLGKQVCPARTLFSSAARRGGESGGLSAAEEAVDAVRPQPASLVRGVSWPGWCWSRWRWPGRCGGGGCCAPRRARRWPRTRSVLPAGDYEHRGFTDLYRFLRGEADPDRRVVSEGELTAQVGDWIGRQALGEPVLAALLDGAPVTVRVPVPAELAFLPYRPWEIAAGGGLVLGREQVRFVFDLAGTRRPPRRAAAPNGPAARCCSSRSSSSWPAAGTRAGPGPRTHPET